MKFDRTGPCVNCPFLKDGPMVLIQTRVKEFKRVLLEEDGTHSCHKTDRPGSHRSEVQHCAGALILLEKLDRPNQMMRIAERLRLYDRTKLKMKAPVFDSFEQMIERSKEHHS